MKTYVVKDEEGKVVTVNEYEEGEKPVEGEKPAAPTKPEEGAKDEAFTPEQVEAIKSIVAEAIAEALKAKENPAPESHDEAGDPATSGQDPEKVGDSVPGASKTGPGSVETKPTTPVTDSGLPSEEEVNKVWENRFKK